MDSTLVGAHVLSVRSGRYGSPDARDAWIFGVVLDRDLDGYQRWIIETCDEETVARLCSAYEFKSHIEIARALLVDPQINGVG